MSWESFPGHDLIWCDPPWEQKMVNFFQTKLKQDSGRVANNTIEGIIDQLAKLASTEKPCYVEYGMAGHQLVLDKMKKRGHALNFISHGIQTSKRPFVIMCFNTSVPANVNRSGLNIVTDTLMDFQGKGIVFDPFAGIGVTATAVRKAGWEYIGSEINPARYHRLMQANP